MAALEASDAAKAIKIIQGAIERIEALEDIHDQTFDFEKERSLKALRETAEQIKNSQPVSEMEQLERELKKAIAGEEFERAAELRDRLKALRARGESSQGGQRADSRIDIK
jgi:protein-arginine kinase activator protein McsA